MAGKAYGGNAAARRAWRERGSSFGAASECRRLDPLTLRPIGIVVPVVALIAEGLTVAPALPVVRLPDWQAAERARRHRALDKLGIAMLEVPVFYDRFIEALIDSGNLTETEALVPANVVAAAAEIIAEWLGICEADLEILKSASRVTRGGKKPA